MSYAEPDRMVLNAYALSTAAAASNLPEPGSLALVALAAGGLAWVRRRRA